MLYNIPVYAYNIGREGDDTMLGDNIKKYRKEKGYTQEELSSMLHVVRQTLSKWENNVSVPDAEVLIRISKALDVPVSILLDLPQEEPTVDLAGELARVNEELAERNGQLQRNALAGKKRGQIIFLSLVALMIMISVRNPIVSLVLVGACFGLALLILYRNLALLSESTISATQMKALKIATGFSALLIVGAVVVCGLEQAKAITLTEQQEGWLAMGIFSCVFLFFGALAPRLPYQRHTGLRLPWTVRDEDTWNLAHKIIGFISLPITLLYLGTALSCSDTDSIGKISAVAVVLYIGIPGIISLIFFWKKYRS